MIAVCLACVLAVFGSFAWNWTYGLPIDNNTKITAVNSVVAIASLVVVTLAGVVAVLAYAIASGKPELRATVQFEFSEPNAPRFVLEDEPGGISHLWPLRSFKQLLGQVTLENSSRYAARNPGVRIKFDGIGSLRDLPGWDTVTFTHMVGVTEIQWDGGADRMIHGEWSRKLPTVNLFGTSWIKHVENPTMTVTLVADGLSPKSTVYPIRLITGVEWVASAPEVAPASE
jgi:hypothetical protein